MSGTGRMELVKLDLGGGVLPYGKGYLNFDITPAPSINVRCDIRHLPVRSGVVDTVMLSQVIEHFPRAEVQGVLEEIFRVLKPGGVLRIAFPDMEKLSRQFRYQPFWVVERHTYGEQTDPYQFHQSGHSRGSMKWRLGELGFKKIRETAQSAPHAYKELTTELEATKGRMEKRNENT